MEALQYYLKRYHVVILLVLGVLLFSWSDSGRISSLAGLGSLLFLLGLGLLLFRGFRRLYRFGERIQPKTLQPQAYQPFLHTPGNIAINPDLEHRQFRIGRNVYDFDELIAYELIESAGADQSILTKGGISVGRAVVGGVLFGGIGAGVGAVTGKKQSYATSKPYADRLYIRIVLNDPRHPHERIDFIKKKTNRNSKSYRKALDEAQEALSLLDFIAHQNK